MAASAASSWIMPMEDPLSTRPFMVVYVAWHPGFADGAVVARHLHGRFRRKLYENVAGGHGLGVVYRHAPDPATGAPLPIDFGASDVAAAVVLYDEAFVADPAYTAWARELMDRADEAGLGARVFPVAIDGAMVGLGNAEQGIRWDRWTGVDVAQRLRRLSADLTYQFCRMLRAYLERLRRPLEEEAALEQYLKKVQIFLSHSKHDDDGQRIAALIRERLADEGGLGTFFDMKDIPAGLRFDKVLLLQVKSSAVVAVHTDSFSSREWCRREILEAKRWSVPLVIANCMHDADERGFPYLGNVPVVRMDSASADRIDELVARLLDEVLRDFLWRCRVVQLTPTTTAGVHFVPRSPELASLAALGPLLQQDLVLVYPDPPLGSEELKLFQGIAPTVRLNSLTEWLGTSDARP